MTEQSQPVRLGVIGGTGLYQIDGLKDAQWVSVESPFGEPSDQILLGNLDGLDVAFLPRHGRGHRVPPGEINFRANIDVLKRVGVTDIVSLSAVGSLRDGLAPGDFLVVDQFVDRTFARVKSFFGAGLAAHVSMAHPVCGRIGADLMQAAGNVSDMRAVHGGTYLVMEGPQFSTLAESELYRAWGCDVIGMSNMPEAKLAREAEICYATVAMVTDYDCWHEDHDNVSVEGVIQVVNDNAAHARSLIIALAAGFAGRRALCDGGCDRALENAVITAPDARDAAMVARLDAVAGRVLAP
ncbi:MAG: S-methyl-5'-thioadenosine phosphorylase [Alphaproteobacteria bacterium]|jgi:5'-methylthioadenosine phosphorylase|nr:S-methyl-5'-thioadenosine phosphorylase [Alphaproteobacteria bacterium]MDP6590213.1 S-methyl-5'-thioadenosine phosphorylase [Alphaproteobacteria bacterium]MDP6817871.1 S-methyl-5'-thioadenosine phosphorylase [Alphaproteobacteria bacterium]